MFYFVFCYFLGEKAVPVTIVVSYSIYRFKLHLLCRYLILTILLARKKLVVKKTYLIFNKILTMRSSKVFDYACYIKSC